jgi:K+-sensing histidine kinase KdpD
MSNHDPALVEKATQYASWSPTDLLRAVRSDIRSPITLAKACCELLLSVERNEITVEQQQEFLRCIISQLDRIDQGVEIAIIALAQREASQANNNQQGNIADD